MYIYINAHVYMHVYTRVCTDIRTQVYRHVYIYGYVDCSSDRPKVRMAQKRIRSFAIIRRRLLCSLM